MKRAATERFGDRAAAYELGRPGYPEAALDRLCEGLKPGEDVIADVGAGTGILSEALLARGFEVRVVEPNGPMREVAARRLSAQPGAMILAGTAEQTGLAPESISLVVAAQAFHWFDPVAARAEFERILRPGGQVGLIWNDPRASGSAFMTGWSKLLEAHKTEDVSVSRSPERTRDVARFFGPRGCQVMAFDNVMTSAWDALVARLASSSYMPAPGAIGYDEMLEDLRLLFALNARAGEVDFEYDALLYIGALSEGGEL